MTACGLPWKTLALCKVRPIVESRLLATKTTSLGFAFLEKSLFTTFTFNFPNSPDETEDTNPPTFQISLSALLETLQIFSPIDPKTRWGSRGTGNNTGSVIASLSRGGPAAFFDNRALDMPSICRLTYAAAGDPLSIILSEAGVTTTCSLVTYEPDMLSDIPLQRNTLTLKIIMRANWLHDAIAELSSTSPARLTIVASPSPPYFTLSAAGPLGEAAVEFSRDPQLLETFQVASRTVNTYQFALVRNAARAMAVASKVSIRGDGQGVLSLQFMIEAEEGVVSFVDFRFVPLLGEDGEDGEEDEEGDGYGDEEEGEDGEGGDDA